MPRITIADPVLRIGAALGPGLGGMFGLPPNLREIASASLGVTYWADSGRARAEVGYATRDLAEGFVDAYGPPVR